MLPMLADPKFNPRAKVLVEEPIANLPTSAAGPDPAGTAMLTDRNTDFIEIDANVSRPSLLLISDNYSSGWRARSLDAGSSQKYEVVRADYTLRGIPLTPGHHHIALEYLPLGYLIGKWISIAAVLAFIGSAVLAWRSQRSAALAAPTPQRRN